MPKTTETLANYIFLPNSIEEKRVVRRNPKQEWEQKDKDINRYKVMYGGPPVDYKKMDVQATDSVKTEIPVESKKKLNPHDSCNKSCLLRFLG